MQCLCRGGGGENTRRSGDSKLGRRIKPQETVKTFTESVVDVRLSKENTLVLLRGSEPSITHDQVVMVLKSKGIVFEEEELDPDEPLCSHSVRLRRVHTVGCPGDRNRCFDALARPELSVDAPALPRVEGLSNAPSFTSVQVGREEHVQVPGGELCWCAC
jgi:hypothetical protein